MTDTDKDRADAPSQSLDLFPVAIIVALASVGALCSFTIVCAEQHACLKANTCYKTDYCGFKNSITPVGWQLLNQSSRSLNLIGRGVCAPGLRQRIDASGEVACGRAMNFPSALDSEIMDLRIASPPHRRYCGKWIDARKLDTGEQKFSFFDADQTSKALEDRVLNSPLGSDDLSKFRVACESMVVSNTQGASGKVAYDYLRSVITPIAVKDDALTAVGQLASFYCDGPARIGVTFGTTALFTKITKGTVFDESTLRNAMYAVGESRATRDQAIAFAKLFPNAILTDEEHQAAAETIVRASYAGTWVTAGVHHKISYLARNPSLAQFVRALNAPGGVGGANAYLKGAMAVCAYGARSIVERDLGYATTKSASALGRLRASADLFGVVTPSMHLKATTRTWADVAVTDHADPRRKCVRAARVAFTEDFDRRAFDAMVTKRLYDRLSLVFSAIQTEAADTMADDLIGSMFEDVADRDKAVAKISALPPRIAGAPRGTWAGPSGAFRRPELTSNDGALTMLLKQSRAVFLDRIDRVIQGNSVCDSPPLYEATERNAYLLMQSDWACAVLLPGLITQPFADERHDDASLFLGVGYVWAHELCHVTAFDDQWDSTYAGALLHDYQKETFVEAIADVCAVETLRRIGYKNTSICASVSQHWCARVGWAHNPAPSSHPDGNVRGDNLCKFLEVF